MSKDHDPLRDQVLPRVTNPLWSIVLLRDRQYYLTADDSSLHELEELIDSLLTT